MKAPSPKTPHVLAQLSPNGTPQLSVWRTRIENSDAQALWRALHRLVSVHPLVRSALGSQQASAQPTPLFSLHDLTQDLYVLLLQKGRFAHYLSAQMADNEIEREIFQIELTNLLIGNLRRRRPENYRIVRRVSQLLETDPRFHAARLALAILLAGEVGLMPRDQCPVWAVDRVPSLNKLLDEGPEQRHFRRQIERVRVSCELFDLLPKVGALDRRVPAMLDRRCPAVKVALPLPGVIRAPAGRLRAGSRPPTFQASPTGNMRFRLCRLNMRFRWRCRHFRRFFSRRLFRHRKNLPRSVGLFQV